MDPNQFSQCSKWLEHVRMAHSSVPMPTDCWITRMRFGSLATCAWRTHSPNNNRIGGLHLCNTRAWLQILSSPSHVSIIFAENQQHCRLDKIVLTHAFWKRTRKTHKSWNVSWGLRMALDLYLSNSYKLFGHTISLRASRVNSPVNFIFTALRMLCALWILIVAKYINSMYTYCSTSLDSFSWR